LEEIVNKIVEIVFIGREGNLYSIGNVNIHSKPKPEVYINYNIEYTDIDGSRKNLGLHFSRHGSGVCHNKWNDKNHYQFVGKRVSLDNFNGIEHLETFPIGLDCLHIYKKDIGPKSNEIFTVDMSAYENKSFNVDIYILTSEHLNKFLELDKDTTEQIYVYTDCNPILAIRIRDISKIQNNT
jgi:hypothetical protein